MRLHLNDIAYNIYERGTGVERQLVFLHGFGSSGRVWDHVIDGLEAIGYLETDVRCYAPDLRGFGDTAAPATGLCPGDGRQGQALRLQIMTGFVRQDP